MLTADKKISSRKYWLFKEYPFYSYIADSVSFSPKETIPTMGINKRGEVSYNSAFVEGLSNNELVGVMLHELLHWVHAHPLRAKDRDHTLWNVATDIIVNNMLVAENFDLPKCGLVPKDNRIEVLGVTITDIHLKSAEDVYDQLKQEAKPAAKQAAVGWIDSHDEWSSSSEDDPLNDPAEVERIANEIKKVAESAATFARLQGKTPAWMDRFIDKIRRSEIDWRSLLRKSISGYIKANFTWARPNKKYVWAGTYLPALYGEALDVLVHIDTSGSIGDDQLSAFISEIIGISKSFDDVFFRILTGDTEITNDIKIVPGNYNKIKAINAKGGGGTDHVSVFEYAEKCKVRNKILVCFTDGYTTWPKTSKIPTLIVLTRDGDISSAPKWARVVQLKGA